jgi:hypothetical protein
LDYRDDRSYALGASNIGRKSVSDSIKLCLGYFAAATLTTRALDGAEAAVGFDFDGSGWCAAEGHFLKAEG